jgi:hypothetical protein
LTAISDEIRASEQDNALVVFFGAGEWLSCRCQLKKRKNNRAISGFFKEKTL